MPSSFRSIRPAILCLALLAARGSAETGPRLAYERLDLSDGRQLKQVIVKSYDSTTGKLLLFAEGKLMLIPVALMPPPIQNELREGAPKGGATTSSVNDVRKAPAPGATVAPAPSVRPVADDDLVTRHLQLAMSRASNFYRYEYPMGSGATKVTASNFQMTTPEAVPGWTGRYRTKGKAFIEFFDSKGYSFNKTTSSFEVVTEQKPDGSMVVIDFTQK